MDVALLLLVVAPFCYWAFTQVRQWWRNPGQPLPIADTFRPHTGFPGLDMALESYYVDPTAANEAEIVFQAKYAEGAIECCFPE